MIKEKGKIEFSLKTQNPFVATMYHVDHYPAGDGQLGPLTKKPYNSEGDFGDKADWHMYYGQDVPGFPAHPHRGFETVTVVLQGTVDHTDGLGSMGRYADGDVQWMTAGKGLQHAEMFPLIKTEADNTLELFQIWLSLDSAHRMVEPDYKMLWDEDIPKVESFNEAGRRTRITVFAGEVAGKTPPSPTPYSWAYDPAHHLSIQIIELEAGASYTVPAVSSTLNRALYFYEGDVIRVEDTVLSNKEYVFTNGDTGTEMVNTGKMTAKLLLLEAEPIPEEIIAYGPFVMTTMAEIQQAFKDYRETEFGGWPFESAEVYHEAEQRRFATYADGRVEYPDKTDHA